jgi:uracil-DNA glycosylase
MVSARAARHQALAAALRAQVGEPAAVRPFVSDGSPLDCRAFVVGSTPATGMAEAFWTFWDAEAGFRKADWLAAYAAARERDGRGLSATRRLLERIAAAAAPVRVLEANVCGTTDSRDAAVFEVLLDHVRPRAILAHGREAATYLHARFGMPVPANRFADVPTAWGAVRVRAVRHLSRGWAHAAADALGAELAAAAGEGDAQHTTAHAAAAGHGSG